jgi:long-subunit fatty acid transport protein
VRSWLASTFAGLMVLGATASARAGGYDTPILYSARHIGMGGTAVSYVNDPSAPFHNPAGLQGTKRWSVLANVSPVFGNIRATPNSPDTYPTAKDIESGYTLAPFFLVGGAYRLHERVTLGMGVYPVASAGAEFSYKNPFGEKFEDRTKLVFIEAAPGISVQLPQNISVGLTYRMTYVDLDRVQGTDMSKVLDFQMSGINWAGFKLGLQWKPLEELRLGAAYRHKTVTTIESDKGIALTQPFTDISTEFTLPSRFIFGGRYDLKQLPLGFSSDLEYALNSQNKEADFKGTDLNGDPFSAPNVFRWQNAFTVRVGAEYRLMDRKLPLRIGGVWDQKTSNPKYPTAFGTPPGDTWILTGGAGWDADTWQVNVAGAYRTGDGTPTISNGPDHNATCAFCGYTGDKPYKVTMIGLYVDASVNFD